MDGDRCELLGKCITLVAESEVERSEGGEGTLGGGGTFGNEGSCGSGKAPRITCVPCIVVVVVDGASGVVVAIDEENGGEGGRAIWVVLVPVWITVCERGRGFRHLSDGWSGYIKDLRVVPEDLITKWIARMEEKSTYDTVSASLCEPG